MLATADLALYDRSGRLTAIAEVKNKLIREGRTGVMGKGPRWKR